MSHISIFAGFTSAFSPSFASARGAPVPASCGGSVARSHFANTSHWPLTSVRDACSVLLRVRSVVSAVFVVTLCACPTHPVRAQSTPRFQDDSIFLSRQKYFLFVSVPREIILFNMIFCNAYFLQSIAQTFHHGLRPGNIENGF